jgi:hypothetical protein
MSEYAEQKSLVQILQELVDHCRLNQIEDVQLKIALPESTLNRFTLSFYPIERNGGKFEGNIAKLYLAGGTVEFI